MIENVQTCLRRLFANALCLLFFAQSSLAAQAEIGLRLQIVQGNGRQNVLDERGEVPMSVRVTDRNDHPIPGATVVFTTPDKGASGDFGGLKTARILTSSNGLAVARDYRPNRLEGRYPILVQAEYMGELATAIMVQTNVAARKSHGKLIAIAAAAGALGVAFAARGSGNAAVNASPPLTNVPTTAVGADSGTANEGKKKKGGR